LLCSYNAEEDCAPAVPSGEALDALRRRVRDTGQGVRSEIEVECHGERRHFLLSLEPLRGVGGTVGITGAAIDITDAKRVQDELARELAFREQMMGVLGHDLRNPLSAVLALSGLMQRQDEQPHRTREGLQRIEQSARRMNEMIGTLLDFTQLRFRGALPISRESVDLAALARTVVDELRAAHAHRKIEIEAADALRGHWDPGRTAQIVSNLVANALEHGHHDVPIRVSLSGDDATATLVVSNRGPAIPSELVERMFEPFQQLSVGLGNGNGNGKSRGLGLGLFIVREIVQAHGGSIDVRSEGDVTTFAVRLPRAPVG
jgi:signal transduction histidine kinase